MNTAATDVHWLNQALELASHAQAQGEVPVGAVLVLEGEVIGQGWNQPISTSDPTAHAEIIALRAAAVQQKNYRLLNSTLYVTLEPCIMCMGAIIHARVKRLVFGAYDPRAGAVASAFTIPQAPTLNHRVITEGGVLQEACGNLLREFFQRRR